jgi:hypothetical protein
MNDSDLQRLKTAFAKCPKPTIWVRHDLHPVDAMDAADFVRDIESGHDRALLFQSAIRYFELLTDEAQFFLFPDYLGTLIPYPYQVLDTVCWLEDERGLALLEALAPEERDAALQFVNALLKWEGMQPHAEYIQKLADLVSAGRTHGQGNDGEPV